LQPDTAGTAPAFRRPLVRIAHAEGDMATEDWVPLSTCVARMRELHPVYSSHVGYARRDLEAAIRAGRAVLRGRGTEGIGAIIVPITEPITTRHKLDLHHNALGRRTRPGPLGNETIFRDVEIDWTSAASYLRAFAIEGWGAHAINEPLEQTDNSVAKKVSVQRPRGRRPKKRELVMQRMISDIGTGQRTIDELQGMIEKQLASTYHVSRDTARKALAAVVERVANPIPGK
jgi:hypothetical protein